MAQQWFYFNPLHLLVQRDSEPRKFHQERFTQFWRRDICLKIFWKFSWILRKLGVGAKGVMGEVEGRVWMAPKHAGGAHELGGSHAVKIGVVAAHRVGQRVGAHPSHAHARPEPVGTAVYAWRKKSSDAGTLLR